MNFARVFSFNRSLALSVLALAGFFAVSASAQTYTKLYTWPEDTRNDTGIGLAGLMTQGRDGNVYGTVGDDNSNAAGSAFKMTTSGAFSRIYSFCSLAKCADGSQPWGGLSLGKDGNFYGTTMWGGSLSSGTVFKLTPAGALTTVWNFDNGPDGAAPWYPPLQSLIDGDFYGVSSTQYGGDYGAFYKLVPTATPPYKESVPINFNYTNGNDPNLPTQGTDGNYYGSTLSGGTKGLGLVYRTTAAGVETIFHNFTGYAGNQDGANPIGAMVEGNDGAYYGVTWLGGSSNLGTIFKVTSNGTYTLLHSFTGRPDGAYPRSGLILGSDGSLYGTTLNGGTANDGTIYKVALSGQVTVLYNFCSQTGCADGFSPVIPLLQHTNGKFYGSTSGNSLGGSYFYSLDTGLAPFVKMVNWLGKVGNTVELLGQGFTGTTAVSFNGVPATFNNSSDTYMTATVPAGALTGTLTVTTFTGSMVSNRAFLVLPGISSFTPSGTVGSKVTITGMSLTQTTRVTIGGKPASFTVISDTQLTATVPVNALTGKKITVTTAGGSTSSAGTFAVVPLVKTFSPTTGPVETAVTIKGYSFTGATVVTFGGVAATSYSVINDNEVDALVPNGAVTGPIGVTTPGGTGFSSTNFTVTH
ncbi:MAG TPA: choice-of-anchor tandem repeat GloVer-containing protein [Candidatus Sulfotelmatobacter sp.]|nr:choice-of-anchor tandem repeat GloVer-containing protein [Candidatus Sulfotelmatobacter sp.]